MRAIGPKVENNKETSLENKVWIFVPGGIRFLT